MYVYHFSEVFGKIEKSNIEYMSLSLCKIGEPGDSSTTIPFEIDQCQVY